MKRDAHPEESTALSFVQFLAKRKCSSDQSRGDTVVFVGAYCYEEDEDGDYGLCLSCRARKVIKNERKRKRHQIAEGVYDAEYGAIKQTVDSQTGNQAEDCWSFEAPNKFDGKKVKLFMETV